MTYEFRCEDGHITEVFGMSIDEMELGKTIGCSKCTKDADLITSLPQGIALYGNPDGYTKPSATKRFSTKFANKKGNAGLL